MPKPLPENLLAKNKKAYHDYEIIDDFEAGIALTGAEVKSCRDHRANLKGSFVKVFNGEAFAEAIHISPYKFAIREDHKETRGRKLLLHRKQIDKIDATLNEKGISAIPLELYLKGSLIKLKVGICRGRKLHDKRAVLKRKDQDREVARAVSKHTRGT
jgi:SsrA-binding protein